jgi:hypothetical protein
MCACRTKSACEKNPLLLTAREFAVTSVFYIAYREAFKVFFGEFFVFFGVKRAYSAGREPPGKNDLINACGEVFLRGGLLGKVSYFGLPETVPYFNAAVFWGNKAQKTLNKRAFSRAVFADYEKIIAAVYSEIKPADGSAALVAERGVLTGD